MKRAGSLRDRVIFDRPVVQPTGDGGTETGWSGTPESHECNAEFIYQRGSESVEAARLEGRAIYKIRIRSTGKSRQITTDWRMRHVRKKQIYDIREFDDVTDRRWIYLVVEAVQQEDYPTTAPAGPGFDSGFSEGFG